MARGLSRAAIVEAAFTVLDAGGIDAVTVRNVAAELGVKAPALYWHVSSKQDLLDEMGTEIQRRVVASQIGRAAGADVRAELAAYARILRREYLAHRDGARTFSGTRIADPEVLRSQEPVLATWTAGGHDLDELIDAVTAVTAFVVGYVIEEQERIVSGPARYSLQQRNEFVGDDFPLVKEVGRMMYTDSDERFERLLGRLLTGLLTR